MSIAAVRSQSLHRAVVRVLLEKGATSDSTDYLGRTAFHYATFQSDCASLTSLDDRLKPQWAQS